jgi:hypothetical protein
LNGSIEPQLCAVLPSSARHRKRGSHVAAVRLFG